ncbi:MAG: TonB-dependent receptor domain-containing protein [Phormidesmis sp.]
MNIKILRWRSGTLAKIVAAIASILTAATARPVFAQTAFNTKALLESPEKAPSKTTGVINTALAADRIAQSEESTAESTTESAADLTAVTDVQLTPTPEGLEIVLISDGPLLESTSRTSGNALIIDVPNATLDLTVPGSAQQFAPTDGIAVVQLSNTPQRGVEIAITGADAPPVGQVNAAANGLNISIAVGDAIATTDDSDAIQLVVTATRTEEELSDVSRSVTVIDSEALEQQLLFTNNLPDILGRLVPGYAAPSQEDRTQDGGLRGRPIVVLIDGVPQTPNNDGFATSLSTIDPALIEQIEVLRGPSAIYGDGGTGGVVNIITRSPAEDSVAYNASVGTDIGLTSSAADRFGYSTQFGASVGNEDGNALISLSYDTAGAQFDANGNRILPNGIANNDKLGLLAKVGINITEQQRLGLTYSIFRQSRDTRYTFDNAVAADPDAEIGRALFIGADYEAEPEQTNQVLNLTYRNDDLFGSQLDAQLYYRDTQEVGIFTDLRGLGLPEFFPTLWQTTLDDTELGGRFQVDSPIGESASILWGADYSQNDTDSPLFVGDTDILDATGRVTVSDRSLDRFPAYQINSLGLFTQGTWDISEQFQINGGLRYENVDLSVEDYQLAFDFPREREGGSNSFDDVLFNVGMLYRPVPEVGLFGSFSQGFSIPNVGSALALVGPGFDVTGDRLLLPQKVDNYEIGVRLDFDRVQATLAGFYNQSDLGSSISVDFETGTAQVNRAPQRNYGIEATLDWQPTDSWRLGSLLSWNEGEDDIDNDGDFSALSALEIDPIKLGMYVENETTPGWTNRFDLLLIGTRDRSVDAGVDQRAAEGYTVVDFSSQIQLGDGTLSLGIGNLFNNQYATVRQQNKFNVTQRSPALGRTLQVRYSVNF